VPVDGWNHLWSRLFSGAAIPCVSLSESRCPFGTASLSVSGTVSPPLQLSSRTNRSPLSAPDRRLPNLYWARAGPRPGSLRDAATAGQRCFSLGGASQGPGCHGSGALSESGTSSPTWPKSPNLNDSLCVTVGTAGVGAVSGSESLWPHPGGRGPRRGRAGGRHSIILPQGPCLTLRGLLRDGLSPLDPHLPLRHL
jgi:hypothetical protein